MNSIKLDKHRTSKAVYECDESSNSFLSTSPPSESLFMLALKSCVIKRWPLMSLLVFLLNLAFLFFLVSMLQLAHVFLLWVDGITLGLMYEASTDIFLGLWSSHGLASLALFIPLDPLPAGCSSKSLEAFFSKCQSPKRRTFGVFNVMVSMHFNYCLGLTWTNVLFVCSSWAPCGTIWFVKFNGMERVGVPIFWLCQQ